MGVFSGIYPEMWRIECRNFYMQNTISPRTTDASSYFLCICIAYELINHLKKKKKKLHPESESRGLSTDTSHPNVPVMAVIMQGCETGKLSGGIRGNYRRLSESSFQTVIWYLRHVAFDNVRAILFM